MTEVYFPHPHVDMISYFLNRPYRPFSRIRDEKGEILGHLKFGKNQIFHRLDFLPMRGNPENRQILVNYVLAELDSSNNAMLIGLDFDQWDSNIGGHPVVTISSKEDMKKRLIFEDGELKAVQTQRGELLTMNEPIIMVGGYKKSRSEGFFGLDNNNELNVIRMGGAFRMQLDSIKNDDGILKLGLTSNFCYNDSHQRTLALSSDDDKATPRSKSLHELEYKDGLLYLSQPSQLSIDEAIASHDISNFNKKVVESIFEQDRVPITTLLRILLTISPNEHLHQIEGFFTLDENNRVKTTIIDFDGIDNVDTFNHHLGRETLPELTPKEKLISAQLVSSNFLISQADLLITAHKQKQVVELVKAEVRDNPLLSSKIQDSITAHISKDGNLFENNLTGALKLGRLLNTLNITYSPTSFEWLKMLDYGLDKLYFLDIDGYNLAYWEKNGELIDTYNIRRLTMELSRLTGKQIIEAQLKYIYEGD